MATGCITGKRARARPTLILWGQHDALLPPSDGELLDRLVPNSRLVVLDESGHIPQLEQADEFNEALREFLSGRTLGDAPRR